MREKKLTRHDIGREEFVSEVSIIFPEQNFMPVNSVFF